MAEIKAALQSEGAGPIELHPRAAEVYRRAVADLKGYLAAAGDDARAEAFRIIRELVEKIVIRPGKPYAPVDIDIHGRLAMLLEIEDRVKEKPHRLMESVGLLVAGIGFEPIIFRL